jgi:hypothetical protein
VSLAFVTFLGDVMKVFRADIGFFSGIGFEGFIMFSEVEFERTCFGFF